MGRTCRGPCAKRRRPEAARAADRTSCAKRRSACAIKTAARSAGPFMSIARSWTRCRKGQSFSGICAPFVICGGRRGLPPQVHGQIITKKGASHLNSSQEALSSQQSAKAQDSEPDICWYAPKNKPQTACAEPTVLLH